jgi:hypothetical protein
LSTQVNILGGHLVYLWIADAHRRLLDGLNSPSWGRFFWGEELYQCQLRGAWGRFFVLRKRNGGDDELAKGFNAVGPTRFLI